MPFGKNDLEPEVDIELGPPKTIRCFVRGCTRRLRPPTRDGRGDVCPEHGIRCHSSGTYSYADERRNFIVDADVLTTRVVGHPFKYESGRLNMENSEDALTWNVFRSLHNASRLHQAANLVTRLNIKEEPRLYLWGLEVTGDIFEPWDLLLAARSRFESSLPVRRPMTEPDIALYLPGKYLVLIEAKFTSPNSFYVDGPRQNSVSLTKAELLHIYQDQSLAILNRIKAGEAKRVHYQLWRNLIFAEWMAGRGESGTQAFLGSLTRKGYEETSCRDFSQLLNVNSHNRFRHVSWEQVMEVCNDESVQMRTLKAYLLSKSANRVAAFDMSS